MALFTDGIIATVEDLASHDTGVLEVANTESIDLMRKLELAQEEIGLELGALLPRADSFDWQYLLQKTTLTNVVVTSALRLWHVFHTLALTYRDAYYTQLNERYEGKWKEYVELAKWAAEKVMQTGVGIASSPVPKATTPALTEVAGGLAPDTYYVTAAWVNRVGEEGNCAAAQTVTTTAGTTFRASMDGAPAGVTGWNFYAGPTADHMTLQNGSPLQPSEVWTQQTAVSTTGPAPTGGQRPSFLRALPRLLQRG